MQKIIITVLVAALVIFGGSYLFSKYLVGKLDGTGTVVRTTDSYQSAELGISFDYPKKYEVVLQEGGAAQSLILLPQNYEPPVGGEGPPTITVNVYENASGTSLGTWVRENAASNFNLATNKELTETQIGGLYALEYQHSGLYETDAVAVARGNQVYIFSAGYQNLQDDIRAEFQDLISSVHFLE